MPYCTYCGTENPPDGKFCKQCGKPLDSPGQDQVASPPTQPVQRAQPSRAETYILVAAGLYALAAVLIIFSGSVIGIMGIILPAAVALALYFGAYQPLKQGNIQTARSVCLAAAILSVLFAVIDFAIMDVFAAIFALICAAVLLYAWNLLK